MPSLLKQSLTLLLLLVGLPACGGATSAAGADHGDGAAPRPARIESVYDARNDSTVHRLVPPTLAGGAHLIAGAVLEGREAKQVPDRVLIGFRWSGQAPRFAGCELVRWRADGNLVAEVEVTRDVQLGGGIAEFLSGTVIFARAQAMAAATDLDAQACGFELSFPRQEQDLFRQLIRRVSPRPR